MYYLCNPILAIRLNGTKKLDQEYFPLLFQRISYYSHPMALKDQVEQFLEQFFVKYRSFDIIFRDERGKNAVALLALEITPTQRKKIIESLTADDYIEGPLEDTLYRIAEMWVFGKTYKKKELYIKISMGVSNARVICISFHEAEFPLKYPFRQPST